MSPILGIWASSRPAAAVDTGAMFPLQVITVGPAGASSVEFTNIPSTYSHLQIRGIVKGDYAGWGSGNIKFNGSSANYVEFHSLYGDGSSAAANASTTSTAGIQFVYSNGTNPSIYTGFVTDILDYASTNKNKTLRSISGNDLNGSGFIRMFSGLWYATPAAITSINITLPGQNITQYSQFALYGIKGA